MPIVKLTLIWMLIHLSGSFFTFPCDSNSDCIYHIWSKCVSNQCTSCSVKSDCSHLPNLGSTQYSCVNSVEGVKFCQVICEANPTICLDTRTFCDFNYSTPYCKRCREHEDCHDLYGPASFCIPYENTTFCGICTNNSNCTNGQVCTKYSCGPCQQSSECDPDMPCINGACGCTSDLNCTDTIKNRCDLNTKKCTTSCIDDAECQDDPLKPFCSLSTGECVGCDNIIHSCSPGLTCTNSICVGNECLSSGDCNSNPMKPICNTRNQLCYACQNNTECQNKDPGKPFCLNDECVECITSTDCDSKNPKLICSTNHTCIECENDNDCGIPKPYCHTGKNECVECLTSSNCTDELKPTCRNDKCLACEITEECPSGQTCEDYMCMGS